MYAYGDGGPLEGRDPDGMKMALDIYDSTPIGEWQNPCLGGGCLATGSAQGDYWSGGSFWNWLDAWRDGMDKLYAAIDQQRAEAQRLKQRLDGFQLATIILNETGGLSGEGIDEARTAIAFVLLNRVEAGMPIGDLFDLRADNTFLLKLSYWINREELGAAAGLSLHDCESPKSSGSPGFRWTD